MAALNLIFELDLHVGEGHVRGTEITNSAGLDNSVEGEAHGTFVGVLRILGSAVAYSVTAQCLAVVASNVIFCVISQHNEELEVHSLVGTSWNKEMLWPTATAELGGVFVNSFTALELLEGWCVGDGNRGVR